MRATEVVELEDSAYSRSARPVCGEVVPNVFHERFLPLWRTKVYHFVLSRNVKLRAF